MAKCPCLIPDENDNCVDCGQHIELLEVPQTDHHAEVRAIMDIIRLVDDTAKSYERLVKANTDPRDPTQPRMRIIGGVFMRIPHQAFYKQLFGPSYKQAKKLGYRGTFQRWGELLQEAVNNNPSQISL